MGRHLQETDADGVTLQVAAGVASVKDDGITAAKLAHSIDASTIGFKAADSATLETHAASYFATAAHNHSGVYDPAGTAAAAVAAHAGTNTHAQIDTFIASKAAASGLASLDANSKVVQDPANATATPTQNKIPIADGVGGKLAVGWLPTGTGATEVALGNHTHAGAYNDKKSLSATVSCPDTTGVTLTDFTITMAAGQYLTFYALICMMSNDTNDGIRIGVSFPGGTGAWQAITVRSWTSITARAEVNLDSLAWTADAHSAGDTQRMYEVFGSVYAGSDAAFDNVIKMKNELFGATCWAYKGSWIEYSLT